MPGSSIGGASPFDGECYRFEPYLGNIIIRKNKLNDKPIIPYQTPVPIGKKLPKKFEFDEDLYRSLSVYPFSVKENYQIGYCRGYTILSLTLSPFDHFYYVVVSHRRC